MQGNRCYRRAPCQVGFLPTPRHKIDSRLSGYVKPRGVSAILGGFPLDSGRALRHCWAAPSELRTVLTDRVRIDGGLLSLLSLPAANLLIDRDGTRVFSVRFGAEI